MLSHRGLFPSVLALSLLAYQIDVARSTRNFRVSFCPATSTTTR